MPLPDRSGKPAYAGNPHTSVLVSMGARKNKQGEAEQSAVPKISRRKLPLLFKGPADRLSQRTDESPGERRIAGISS